MELLDLLDEALDHLEVHICLEECHAHLAHRFVDVILCKPAMSAELLECLLQTVC